MALQAIAAFFVPLSPEETREMYMAARRARLADVTTPTTTTMVASAAATLFPLQTSTTATDGLNEDDEEGNDDGTAEAHSKRGFVPLRPTAPLAFISAHPLCRVVAEGSPEGVQVGHTHYERPEPPPLPSTQFVWDISPPPPPELVVHVSRLPLHTSGLSEGLWWLRSMSRARREDEAFHSPSEAVTTFPPFCPVHDIRLTLEKAPQTTSRAAHRQRTGSDAVHSAARSAVTGSKENPVRDEDLALSLSSGSRVGGCGVGGGQDDDICGIPFTSLELQQLCFLPSALRLLPCLFGPFLSTVLFTRCSCLYDAMLRDPQRCQYTSLPSCSSSTSSKGVGSEGRMGVVLPTPSDTSSAASHVLPYGALGLTYLSMSACGTEAFWICMNKFFILPQCSDGTQTVSRHLAPLLVLDLGDNKSLTTKQLQGVLHSVKQRNTAVLTASVAESAPGAGDCVSLRELNTCFTCAIQGVQWRKELAGLGTSITRLAMARCDIEGEVIVDILCAGDAASDHPAISDAEEPFSAAIRRLLLLDVRWNLKVKSDTIRKLRDDYAIHCKHLRLAGSGLDWEEGHRFASTVTP